VEKEFFFKYDTRDFDHRIKDGLDDVELQEKE
jgi:hypothetical protein